MGSHRHPTPAQADALRRAVEHPKGYVSASKVVRRNLIELGYARPEQITQMLHNRVQRITSGYVQTVHVITDEGRAAIGAEPARPVDGVVDIDEEVS